MFNLILFLRNIICLNDNGIKTSVCCSQSFVLTRTRSTAGVIRRISRKIIFKFHWLSFYCKFLYVFNSHERNCLKHKTRNTMLIRETVIIIHHVTRNFF